MTKPTRWLFALAVCVFLTSCSFSSIVRELKEDPAVVATTGFYTSIGFDPSPSTGMVPLPNIKLGHGTAVRVGIHDCIFLSDATGARAYINTQPQNLDDNTQSQTQGDATQTSGNPPSAAAASSASPQSSPPAQSGAGSQPTPPSSPSATATSPASPGNTANKATGVPSQASQSPCIPQAAQIMGPAASGTGAGGESYLTISASGLDGLKARWQSQSKCIDYLPEILKAIKAGNLTVADATTLLNSLKCASGPLPSESAPQSGQKPGS